MMPKGNDPGVTRRFLELLRMPVVGCTELRILRAAVDRRGNIRSAQEFGSDQRGSTLAGWYDEIDRLAGQSRRLRGISGYVTINPVSSVLLARCDNRLGRVKHTTRDADIACLRWLFLDIDPVRPPDISANASELAAAICRRDAILAEHPDFDGCGALGVFGQWRLDPGAIA
jgi:hypothetical protein